MFVLATDSGLNSRLANLLGVVAEAAFLYVFWRLGDFFPILHGGQHDLFSVEGAIGRLGIAGVTTAAILSGAEPIRAVAVLIVIYYPQCRWPSATRGAICSGATTTQGAVFKTYSTLVLLSAATRFCTLLQGMVRCRPRTTTWPSSRKT